MGAAGESDGKRDPRHPPGKTRWDPSVTAGATSQLTRRQFTENDAFERLCCLGC